MIQSLWSICYRANGDRSIEIYFFEVLSEKGFASGKQKHKVMFHIQGRSGVYIGNHSWIGSDEEVLFDRKIKFRALKSHEKGYIKPYSDEKGIFHIAITEV